MLLQHHGIICHPALIPLFAQYSLNEDSERQQTHYNKIAQQYIENLSYPHTIEYQKYLDAAFKDHVALDKEDEVAELCCGYGELLSFFDKGNVVGIGVDISINMLESAKAIHKDTKSFSFMQGDATNLPLKSESFTKVFIFGGIHHVPDRVKLFAEVYRILKPGGRFYFREPVKDFILWRLPRAIIYWASPILDEKTERPLLFKETVPLLKKTGFSLVSWKTYGFLGFCFFMNSDVMVFNRYFRYIPGIRRITKIAAFFDNLVLKLPFLKHAGLQVIGVAEKPIRS